MKRISDASDEILRCRSWKGVCLDEEVFFFLLLSKIRPPEVGREGHLHLYFRDWGFAGVLSCSSLPVGPLLPQDAPAGGWVGRSPEPQKAVVQWSGLGLGAAMSPSHAPPPRPHPRPVPRPVEGRRGGIQSPFSSNDFSLCEILMYTIDFEATELTQQIPPPPPPPRPRSYENFEFV